MTTPLDDTGTDDTTDVSDDDIISAIVDRASNDDDFLDSLLSALDNAGLLDTGEEEGQEETGNTGNGAGGNGAGNGSQSAAETALRNLLTGKAM